MKTNKQIAKRLALGTETLRTLAGQELDLAAGGAGSEGCPPPPPTRTRIYDHMGNCI